MSSLAVKDIFGFKVIAPLGTGAASMVFAVQDPGDKQIYALKHVVKNTDKDQRFLDQVELEYEIGSKLSLMNDRLLLSAAVYQLTQGNRLFNPPEEPTIVLQIGKVRARGIEAEATGEILPGFERA